jgi:hypothetical protein
MKTTIEIPEALFRRAKATAALRGIRLRDLVEQGIHLAIQMPETPAPGQRTAFPLIRSSSNAPRLTDEQVDNALTEFDQEEAEYHAGFVRH